MKKFINIILVITGIMLLGMGCKATPSIAKQNTYTFDEIYEINENSYILEANQESYTQIHNYSRYRDKVKNEKFILVDYKGKKKDNGHYKTEYFKPLNQDFYIMVEDKSATSDEERKRFDEAKKKTYKMQEILELLNNRSKIDVYFKTEDGKDVLTINQVNKCSIDDYKQYPEFFDKYEFNCVVYEKNDNGKELINLVPKDKSFYSLSITDKDKNKIKQEREKEEQAKNEAEKAAKMIKKKIKDMSIEELVAWMTSSANKDINKIYLISVEDCLKLKCLKNIKLATDGIYIDEESFIGKNSIKDIIETYKKVYKEKNNGEELGYINIMVAPNNEDFLEKPLICGFGIDTTNKYEDNIVFDINDSVEFNIGNEEDNKSWKIYYDWLGMIR